MDDLIKRLEAAEAGSRELDALLWKALHPRGEIAVKGAGRPGLVDWRCRVPGATIANSWTNPPAATTSLDAALSLAERLWPHVMWRIGHDPDDGSLKAELVIAQKPGDPPAVSANAFTAPLALCAAVLRARSETSPDNLEGEK